MSEHSLRQVQHWLQTVLIVRGDLDDKLLQAYAHDGVMLDTLIKSTDKISAQQRVDIYAAGYVLRLVDCLRCEFSLLAQYMGDSLFSTFAKAFIVTVPSKSWSLYYLGEQFAEFLAQTKPQGIIDVAQQTMVDLPAQIALFERTKSEVLVAQGLEKNVTATELSIEQQMLTCLVNNNDIQAAPCLRVITLDYPILELISQIEACIAKLEVMPDELILPIQQPCYLALTRIHYRFRVWSLAHWQYLLLGFCIQGSSFNMAIKQTALQLEVSSDELTSDAMMWLPQAINMGLLFQ